MLFGLAQAFIFVPLYALLHAVWPEGGRRGFNLLYVSNNAGVAIGTAIGGMIAQVSFRLIFSLNAVAFFIYLLLVIIGVSEQNAPVHLIPTMQQTERLTKDKGFKVLLALGGGIFFVWGAYIQLVTILPVVMNQLGFSAAAAQLAPQGKKGAYQGIIGGASSGGRMVGPFLGGMMYDFGGGSSVWELAITFMGASMVMFFIYGKVVQRFHLLQQIQETEIVS